MQCCDRCKLNKPIVLNIKIKGKGFELCGDCADCLNAYIQFSYEPPSFLGRLKNLFGGGK